MIYTLCLWVCPFPTAVFQPLCSTPCRAQHGAFSQNVWLYSILRGCMALTPLPVESSSYKLWLYRGKVQNNLWTKFIPTICSPTWHTDMVKGRELPHTSSGWLCAQLASVYPQIMLWSSKYKVCLGVSDYTHNHCKASPNLPESPDLSWITKTGCFKLHFLRKS